MFEIKFLSPPEESQIRPLTGQIKINRFTENFQVSNFSWLPQDYMEQWESAINQLLKKKNSSAVIISEITSPCKNDVVRSYILYRINDTVHVQSRLFPLKGIKGRFNIEKLAEYAGPRETETPLGDVIPEWTADIKDFEDFLKKLPKLKKPYEEFYGKLVEKFRKPD